MSSKISSKSRHNNSNISEISKFSPPGGGGGGQKSKSKKSKKYKKHKKYRSCKIIPRFPNFKKKLRETLEEKEEIEFVLGDFKDFHKMEELNTFKNMTSLTLINESIKDISIIISHLPNPLSIIYLCLNQNLINSLDNIYKLQNLQELQINFNFIEKIPGGIFQLKKLKKFWACENNICVIENLDNNIESLWLANNYIENIPKNFGELKNLKELNLAGNLICDLNDLFLISEIKGLKKIYLSDINFGENPICYFYNYRKIMVQIFNYVEIIDQIKLTFDEKFDINRFRDITIKQCYEKIKNNFKISNMILKMIKIYFYFFSSFEIYKNQVMSIKLKFLEYNNNDNYEIEDLKYKIEKNIEQCNKMKEFYHKLKNNIKELNDSFIIYHTLNLETYNNIEIIPLLPNNKNSLFCIDLMKSQLNNEFMQSNFYTGISFNEIYQIKDKKNKYIFNAIYNDLIDENNQFGTDIKFKKFLYIIIPDKILYNKRKLFNYFTENQKTEENYFFCDNYSYLDENELNSDKNYYENKTVIICKCIYFESSIEIIDARFNYFNSIEDIKNYLINLKNNSKKDIVCVKVKYNVNFYIYNNKGLILPKYIIKYNYKKSEFDFISNYDINEENIIKLKLNINNEKLFNLCANHFFNINNNNNENKYYKNKKQCLTNFYDYNQLDNNFFFFVKNSLINFLNKCFKYKDKEEYFNEIKILNDKIKEINEYSKKDENNFLINYDKYINDREKEQNNINFRKIKQINLFNQKITNKIFDEFLSKLSNDLTKFNEISIMTIKCEILSLSKNELKLINLSQIFNLFPNLQKIDLSHNKISQILLSNNNNTDIDINKYNSLKHIDISFNEIKDINIIEQLKNSLKNVEIFYYANPLEKNNKIENDKNIFNPQLNNIICCDKKKLFFFEYIRDFFSYKNEINDFNNLIYFLNGEKFDISNNYKDKIIYLIKKNLYSIDNNNIDNNNNLYHSNIIYLNSNKITEIKNFNNFIYLSELFLQNNKIQLIENLPLTLIKIDLSNNYITNIDFINKNINLEFINVEINFISKINTLFNLKKLKEIHCANNLIDDFTEDEFTSMKNFINLEKFDFSGNGIIYTQENIRIKIIYNCPSLIQLNKKIITEKEKKDANYHFNGKLTIEILEKRVKEQSVIEDNINFNSLIYLDLSGLNLKDEILMFDRKKYPNLKKLNLSKNFFTTLEIFGFLPELNELDLNCNSFNELVPKKYIKIFKSRFNFSNLKILDISNNKLENINGIQNMVKLRKINLKDNFITKLDSLDKLNDLYNINISNNKLRSCDKSNLGILPSLKIFLCDNNFLKSINCFEKYNSLENISFNSNRITDLSCLDKLSQLKKLTKLSLINNPITRIENYRKLIVFYFQRLKFLDNKEIISQERIINNNTNNTNTNNANNTNELNTVKNNSKIRTNSKRDEMLKIYYTYNENNKYQKLSSKKLDYFNVGYRVFQYPRGGEKFFDFEGGGGGSPKRSSHTELNINILQSKNEKDFNKFLFLSKANKIKKNYIPALKLSNSKKYDEIILLNKYKNKRSLKRPFSSTNTRKLMNKTKPIIGNRNDYFSIVLNSFGNNGKYAPLVTLKNFNVKKINF